MVPHRVAAAVVLLAAPALAACQPGTVTLDYRPEVGDTSSYRYDLDATITQRLDGEDPATTAFTAILLVEEEVVALDDEGASARLVVTRDDGAPRVVEVRLDRSGTLAGIDLVEGQPSDALGLGVVQGVLAGVPLPDRPLAPGDRWRLEEEVLDGEGRLRRLGTVDGRDVAVVEATVTQVVDQEVPTAGTTALLSGTIRSRSRTSYDLADGSVRRGRSTARGEVEVLVQPPEGVDAAPVAGTITYEVRVSVRRLG